MPTDLIHLTRCFFILISFFVSFENPLIFSNIWTYTRKFSPNEIPHWPDLSTFTRFVNQTRFVNTFFGKWKIDKSEDALYSYSQLTNGSHNFFMRIPNIAKRLHSSSQHFLANEIVAFKIIEKNTHFLANQMDPFLAVRHFFCVAVRNIIGSEHQQFARFFVAVSNFSNFFLDLTFL